MIVSICSAIGHQSRLEDMLNRFLPYEKLRTAAAMGIDEGSRHIPFNHDQQLFCTPALLVDHECALNQEGVAPPWAPLVQGGSLPWFLYLNKERLYLNKEKPISK